MSEDEERTPAEERGRLREALEARREKLQRLRDDGIEPFALRFDPDTSLASVRERFGELEAGAETGTTVKVAGRIVLLRRHGGSSFATLRDGSGDLQLF